MDKNTKLLGAYQKMEAWLGVPDLQPSVRQELENLEQQFSINSDDKDVQEEILDRFYRDLEFGTGGLRGILGAGTNRMNIYTVRRVVQGLSVYLRSQRKEGKKPLSVAIAYDSRHQSHRFALETAGVLMANGIEAYIFPELMPTPLLSFAVRHLACDGGVMITASHNPAEYNGCKIYNSWGCQVNLEEAAAITAAIDEIDFFQGVETLPVNWEQYVDQDLPQGKHRPHLISKEVEEAYYREVLKRKVGVDASDLEVVYTPLNGTGNKPVRRILSEIGVGKVHVVKEQELPDGDFPTCPYPNPEKREALHLGLLLSESLKTPDILLATDPDCDRLSAAVLHEDAEGKMTYQLLSGNEIGILLLDFLCSNRPLPRDPVAMRTIVSSKLADRVAESYGVSMVEVLTGFKFIGEKINELEEAGQEERFVLGFEESYGYLAGTYVRDKDAVNAAMLLSEAAAFEKERGKTLVDRMEAIYLRFGYYKSDLMEIAFDGSGGMDEMKEMLTSLRENPPTDVNGKKIIEVSDYLKSQKKVLGTSCAMAAGFRPIQLPKSDVLAYGMEDGSTLIVRPSGTEPKLKLYISSVGASLEEAMKAIEEIQEVLSTWIQ